MTTSPALLEAPLDSANNSEFSQIAAERSERVTLWQLPRILWAGAGLFTVNLGILLSLSAAPKMQVNMYGHEPEPARSYTKPSPFLEVVPMEAARKIKEAEKLRPVLSQEPAQAATVDESMQLTIPRASVRASVRASEELTIPRVSQVSWAPHRARPLE